MTNNGSNTDFVATPFDKKQFILDAIEEFERPLTRYAYRLFQSSGEDSLESAKDVVQQSFLRLCKQEIASLQNKIGPWLYRVCRNLVIDRLRKAGKFESGWPPPLSNLCDDRWNPARQTERREMTETISQLIGQLSGAEREVIELWSQGLNHDRIAHVLNKKPGAVRVALHRAIKRLQAHPTIQTWLQRATSQDATGDGLSRQNAIGAKTKTKSPSSLQGEKS